MLLDRSESTQRHCSSSSSGREEDDADQGSQRGECRRCHSCCWQYCCLEFDSRLFASHKFLVKLFSIFSCVVRLGGSELAQARALQRRRLDSRTHQQDSKRQDAQPRHFRRPCSSQSQRATCTTQARLDVARTQC